jgi:hypothetical protein
LFLHQNPVKARLVEAPELFAYSSAFPGVEVDPAPPWLKPVSGRALYRGAPENRSGQNDAPEGTAPPTEGQGFHLGGEARRKSPPRFANQGEEKAGAT